MQILQGNRNGNKVCTANGVGMAGVVVVDVGGGTPTSQAGGYGGSAVAPATLLF